MGKVCAKCGTENREKAMFCKGCGAKMATAPSPASVDGASSNCPDCATPNPTGSRFCKSCGCSLLQAPPPPTPIPLLAVAAHADGRPVFEPAAGPKGLGSRKLSVVALLLAAAALTAWFYLHQKNQSPQPAPIPSATLPVESEQPAAKPQVSEVQVPAVSTPETAPASSVAAPMVEPVEPASAADRGNAQIVQDARLNQERIERERRERRERQQAAQEQSRAAQELERQRAEQARRQAQSAPAQPAGTVPVPPTQPVAPALTVARICDDAGNFIMREVCRVRECLKTSQANDPICVNFRKMEEANRSREQRN